MRVPRKALGAALIGTICMEEFTFTPDCLTINGARYWREDAAQRRFEQTPGVERWYSVTELASISGYSRSSIYRAMESGALRYRCPNGLKIGRRVKQSWWEDFAGT